MPESQTPTRDVFVAYWKYIGKYKWLMCLIFLFSAISTLLSTVITPLYYKKFFDVLSSAATTHDANAVSILFSVLLISIGLQLAGIFFGFLQSFFNAKFQIAVSRFLLPDVFRSALGQSYKFFADTMVGSLVKKISRFNSAFQDLADMVASSLLPLILSVIGIIFVLYRFDAVIATVMLVWAAITIGVNFLYVRFRLPVGLKRAELDSVTTGVMSDGFTNSLNVKLFNGRDDEVGYFTKKNTELYDVMAYAWKLNRNIDLVRDSLMLVLELTVMGLAIQKWQQGKFSVGDLVLFQTYVFTLAGRVAYTGGIIRQLFNSVSDAKEAIDLINTPYDVTDKRRAKTMAVTKGKVEFKDVTFNYNETRPVLTNFDLTIIPREKVALVGSSGAGKSTLVKLLFRFYDLDGGKIQIDGQNIADVSQESLREKIALVPQDPILFHRSLRENIGYGRRDATEKEIVEAAKQARCHEFIMQTPKGYDTFVGERGVKLSGGERQRVVIARAILKNAPILVLDEATSSLDSESEALIQDALRQLMKNKTVIVIAHRLSTIMQMDRIIVMENGKVTDTGTHDELLKKVGIYQKLWNIQAGGFQQA